MVGQDTARTPGGNQRQLDGLSGELPALYNIAMRQVILYPDPEDGGWVAEVPSLPGCVSQGDSREDALRNIRAAIQAWIEAAESLGRDVTAVTSCIEGVPMPAGAGMGPDSITLTPPFRSCGSNSSRFALLDGP